MSLLISVSPFPFSAPAIEALCSALANKTATSETAELDAFAEWFRGVYTFDLCFSVSFELRTLEASIQRWYYIENLNWYFEESPGFPFPSRPSLWLACTQLGGWATNVNSQSIFQNDIGQDAFFEYCQTAFEDYDYAHLEKSVASLNRRFGGNQPSISNVIYTNAGLDPWSPFGVTNNQTSANTYVFNLGKLLVTAI